MGTVQSLTTNNEKSQAYMIPIQPKPEASNELSSLNATYGSSQGPGLSDKAITNFEVAGKDPHLPCFSMQVQRRQRGFFGRKDILDLIDEDLLPSKTETTPDEVSSLRSFALCGMGGMGKTQIAIEYAYTRRSEYDAIFFVTADNKNILSAEFARIALELGLEDESETKDLAVSCEVVRGWLSNPVKTYAAPSAQDNEASWLLIFDNADDLDILDDFWPTTGIGSVLITSRDSEAKEHNYFGNNGIDLQPFSGEDAIRFLNTLSRKAVRADQEEYAVQVADRLGGLPYLLTQMAGVMSRLRMSYSEFLALLDAKGIEKTSTSPSTPERVFSISSKLGLDGLTPASLALLTLISVLDPDRIPESILVNACTGSAALDDFPKDAIQYYEARAQLLQTSLIYQSDTGDIYLHRIAQDVARDKLDQPGLVRVFQFAVWAVSLVWPFVRLEQRFTTKRYPRCEAIFPSVVRLRTMHERLLSPGPARHQLSSARLLGDTGW